MLTAGHARGQVRYAWIDANSTAAPDSLTVAAPVLARHLTRYVFGDAQKARALYVWITHNIRYDVEQIEASRSLGSTAETLARRGGVCQDYAELFAAMASAVGLECHVVSGYTKDHRGIAPVGHAWNAVLIDSSYLLIDATWGAGYLEGARFRQHFDEAYFLVAPTDLLTTHMPFDPIWQFSTAPITHAEFVSRTPAPHERRGGGTPVRSLPERSHDGSPVALEAALARMGELADDTESLKLELPRKHYRESVLGLALAHGERAVRAYNVYVDFYNRRWRAPRLSDADLARTYAEAEMHVDAALEALTRIASAPPSQRTAMGADAASDQLRDLRAAVRAGRSVVDRYLRTWKPLRMFVM